MPERRTAERYAQSVADLAALLHTRAVELTGTDATSVDDIYRAHGAHLGELYGYALALATIDGGRNIAAALLGTGRHRVIEAQLERARQILAGLRDPE